MSLKVDLKENLGLIFMDRSKKKKKEIPVGGASENKAINTTGVPGLFSWSNLSVVMIEEKLRPSSRLI